jgi:hypothetical protein
VTRAALAALADAAEALARLAREVARDAGDEHQDGLLPLAEAARLAATSKRVVRDAVRKRELVAFGRERDRAVRRSDLDAWIASRQVQPTPGVADADIEVRMARLSRLRRDRDEAANTTKTATREPPPPNAEDLKAR